jgi:hypothetical protein
MVGAACTNGACVCRPPAATNILQDPGFKSSITTAWTLSPPSTVKWDYADADACDTSGSMTFTGEGLFSQCVTVQPNRRYYVGIKYRQPDDFNVFCSFIIYPSTNCSGDSDLTGTISIFDATAVNAWTNLSGMTDTSATARSASFLCRYWGGTVYLDQAYVNTSDGF